MKYKSPDIEVTWLGRAPRSLRALVSIADEYRIAALDGVDITITSFLRTPNTTKVSYHTDGMAVDLRTHDMSATVRSAVLALLRSTAERMNEDSLHYKALDLQVIAHDELLGTPEAHIHIELDDGRYNLKHLAPTA